MMRRIVLLLSAAALAAFAQKYDGPRPPKPDLPYLKHASELVPTEAGTGQRREAKERRHSLCRRGRRLLRRGRRSPLLSS